MGPFLFGLQMMDYTMAGMEDVLGHLGNMKLRDKFKQIDNRYIRPCLIREHKAHEPKILETYSKLAMKVPHSLSATKSPRKPSVPFVDSSYRTMERNSWFF